MRLTQNLKDLMEKTQNPKIFWNRFRIGAASSLESSMKQILWRFESNKKKSKQMKINDVFDRFTFKASSAAILMINFHLYQRLGTLSWYLGRRLVSRLALGMAWMDKIRIPNAFNLSQITIWKYISQKYKILKLRKNYIC